MSVIITVGLDPVADRRLTLNADIHLTIAWQGMFLHAREGAIGLRSNRPRGRFVLVKSEATQGEAMVFRVWEPLIRQRTQAISALRGHLPEFGQIVPQGAANTSKLTAIVEDPDSGMPAGAIITLTVLVMALAHLEAEIGKLNAEIARWAKENDVARRLMTVPALGHAGMP